MRLPRSVKVGYRTFPIHSRSPAQDEYLERTGALGYTERHDGYIVLRRGLPENIRGEVLLHEVLHAIWWQWGIRGSKEEGIVNPMGLGLSAVIRDNPKLLPFIASALSS